MIWRRWRSALQLTTFGAVRTEVLSRETDGWLPTVLHTRFELSVTGTFNITIGFHDVSRCVRQQGFSLSLTHSSLNRNCGRLRGKSETQCPRFSHGMWQKQFALVLSHRLRSNPIHFFLSKNNSLDGTQPLA